MYKINQILFYKIIITKASLHQFLCFLFDRNLNLKLRNLYLLIKQKKNFNLTLLQKSIDYFTKKIN